MPALAGSPWRALAKVVRDGGTGTRVWAVGVGIADETASGDQGTWTATPGSSLTLTFQTGTTGIAPAAANTVTIEIRTPDGAQIGTTDWTNPADGETRTFHFDDDPLDQSAGTARAGMVEIYLRVVRTDLGTYDVDSRGTGAAASDDWAQGYLRAPSTLSSHSLSNVAIDGAEPGTWAYGDPIHTKATLDATLYRSNELTVAVRDDGGSTVQSSAMSSASAVQTKSWTAAGDTIDNSFDVGDDDLAFVWPTRDFGGDNEYVWAASGHDVAFTRESDLILADAARLTIDPRLTVDHHLQLNDSSFATPPGSLDDPNHQRLTSDLGFVGFRLLNARSEGVNGLTATETLDDDGGLVASAINRSVTTQAQGGQDGWVATWATWDSALPGGGWTHAVDVTSPAGATGLEVTPSSSFTLLAKDPNLSVIPGAGPKAVADDGDHWHPGEDLLVGLAVYDVADKTTIAVDTDGSGNPRAYVVVGRFNTTLGRAEYLGSDHQTWSAITGGTAYEHQLAASPGDASTYVMTFAAADTATWNAADVFVIGIAYVNSTPYSLQNIIDVLSASNAHDGYGLDAMDLALNGTISQR